MVIQEAMGWESCHLHEFIVGGVHYGMDDEFAEVEIRDEWSKKLKALSEHKKISYIYDFGDGWSHTITFEKIVNKQLDHPYPYCSAGARACPPEDCGGPCGYPEFLEAIKNPTSQEDREVLEWVGDFDPEACDVKTINERISSRFSTLAPQ